MDKVEQLKRIRDTMETISEISGVDISVCHCSYYSLKILADRLQEIINKEKGEM